MLLLQQLKDVIVYYDLLDPTPYFPKEKTRKSSCQIYKKEQKCLYSNLIYYTYISYKLTFLNIISIQECKF